MLAVGCLTGLMFSVGRSADPRGDYPIVISAPPEFERMQRDLTGLRSHIRRLEKQLASSRQKEVSLRSYIKAVKKRMSEAEKKARSMERALAERERVYKRDSVDVKSLRTQVSEQRARIEHLEKASTRDLLKRTALEQQLENVQRANAALQNTLNEQAAEIELMQADLEARATIATRESSSEVTQEDLSAYRKKIAALEDELAVMATRVVDQHQPMVQTEQLDWQQKVSTLEQTLTTKESALKQRDKQVADLQKALKNRDLLLEETNDADNTISVLAQSLNDYEDQIQKLQDGYADLQTQLDSATRSFRKEREARTELQQELEQARQDKDALLKTAETRETKTQEARHALHQERLRIEQLQEEIDRGAGTLQKALHSRDSLLEKASDSDATITMLAQGLKDYEARVEQLTANISDLKLDLGNTELAQAKERDQRLKAEDQFAIVVDDKVALEIELATADTETAELRGQSAAARSQISQLKDQLTCESASLQKALKNRDILLKQAGEADNTITVLATDLKEYEDQVAVLQRATSELQAQVDNANRSRAQELKKHKSLEDDLRAQLRSEQQTAKKTASSASDLREKVTALEQTLKDAQMQSSADQSEVSLLTRKVTDLERTVTEQNFLLEDSGQIDRRATQLETDLQTTRAEAADLQQQLDKLNDYVAGTEQELAQERKDRQRFEDSLAVADKKNASLSSSLEAKEETVAELQEALEEREAQLQQDDGSDKIITDLEETLSEAQARAAILQSELAAMQIQLDEAEHSGAFAIEERNQLLNAVTDLRNENTILKDTVSFHTRRFEELKSSVKSQDTGRSPADIARLESTVENQKSRITVLSEQIAELQAELENTTASGERTELERGSLENLAASLRSENRIMKEALRSHEEEILQLREALAAREVMLEDAAVATEASADQVARLQTDLAQQKLRATEATQLKTELAALEGQHDALKKSLAEREETITDLHWKAKTQERMLMESVAQIESSKDLQARVDAYDGRIDDLRDQVARQDQLLKEARRTQEDDKAKKAAAAKAILKLRRQRDDLEQSIEGQRSETEELRALVRQLESQTHTSEATQQSVRELEDTVRALRQQSAIQEETMSIREKQIDRLKDDLAEKPPPKPTAQKPKKKRKTAKTTPVSSSKRGVAEAQRQLKRGKVDEARQLFEQALASGRDTADVRFGLAACYYAQRDLFQARKTLDQLLDRSPAHAQALGLRGMIAYREDDLTGATDYLQKAVILGPNNAQLHNYYGIVLHARLQQKPAIREFRKSIALDSECAEAHYNLAYLLATTINPELDRARVHYEAALRLGSARDEKLERVIYQ